MSAAIRVIICVSAMCCATFVAGCDESARVVQETERQSFDDMARQAAAETALSEQEE